MVETYEKQVRILEAVVTLNISLTISWEKMEAVWLSNQSIIKLSGKKFR